MVGPYRLLERVGSGGLATVWRAQGPEGEVAVKVMSPNRTTPEQVTRIHREFIAMKLMDSPHVVKVLSSGEEQGYPWLSLEYVGGGTLDSLLKRWDERPTMDRFGEAARLLRGLCSALAHIHEKGLVHRDIKPSNILVDREGLPKLTDFGSVKAPDQFTTNLTMAGHLVGTVAFMAPEQITEDEISPRVDLYALGAVFYVMLTGRRPVEADSIAGYLAKHLMEDPPPPLQVDPRCPRKLSRLCMKLMRKDPAQRPQSAIEVIEALDAPEAQTSLRLHGRDELLRQSGQRLQGLRRGEGGEVALLGLPGSGRSVLLAAIEEQALELGLVHHGVQLPCEGGLSNTIKEHVEPLLREGLEQPLVLLIDDLDAAKRPEIGALEALLRDTRSRGRLLVIYGLTGQVNSPLSEDTSYLLERLSAGLLIDVQSEPLDCGPISRKATITLLRDQGFAGKAATLSGARLHSWCDGNPRAILESVQAFHEAGWLRERSDGALELTVPGARVRGGDLPVPQAHRELVEGILVELEPTQRRALQALAILDGEADLGLIAGLCPGGPRALGTEALDPIVLRAGEGLQEQLRFARKDTQRVVLEGLDGSDRARLNRAAAELLIRKHRRRQGSVAERAATHFLRAGESEQAWPLLARAAQWSMRRHRVSAALLLAERALEVRGLVKDAGQQELMRQLLALQGHALLELGRADEAGLALQAALELSSTDLLGAETKARLGMALLAMGHPSAARTHLQGALTVLPQNTAVRHACIRALAEAFLQDGRRADAARTWEEALTAARRSGEPAQEGRCLLGLGHLELRAGSLIRAARALELAERKLPDQAPRDLALCLLYSGNLALLDGRLRVALDRGRQALRLAKSVEQADLLSLSQLLLTEAYMSAGNMDECHAMLPGLIAQEAGDPVLDAVGQDLLHNLALQILGPSSVRGLPALDAAPATLVDAARWELYRAWAMIREGASGAAMGHAKRCSELCEGPGMASLRMESLLCLGALGVPPSQELRELVQRQLSGMPEELRRGFVGRLQRLGLFPG
ncbi:MAG: tetratricopeptide (TPR) repeat protein [Cognaticolwellia sp.]